MLKLNYPEIYTNVNKCIEYLKKNYTEYIPTSPIQFHCFWSGTIGDKHITSIKSFLVTQPHNYHINLWLDKDNGWNNIQNNQLLNQLKKNITIRCYDYNIEKLKTIYEHYNTILPNNVKLKANRFRYLILHNYGGVYFDLDCIFIKSFEPLINLDIEFCYQWSIYPFANNAIMRVKKKSEISKEILNLSIKYLEINGIESEQTALMSHFIFKTNHFKNLKFYMLPCTFFDPIWILVDNKINNNKYIPFTNFTDFFKNTKKKLNLENFCKGIFVYHWHSRFKIKPEINSPYEYLKKDINNKFNKKN